jgi:hypothetical protein
MRLLKFVKHGGYVFLEAFLKEQLNFNTGGPPSLSLLYSLEMLEEGFINLSRLKIRTEIKELNKGEHHKGLASIMELTG